MRHYVMSWPARVLTIERRPGTPLYELVLVELTEALFDDPPPGDKLPPEPELCDRFSVSRTTLRRALDELEARGVVIRRQGLGTFFVGRNPVPAIPDLISSMDVLRAVPGFTSKCLVFETVAADSRLAASLEIDDGSPLHHVRRLDRVGLIPVALVDVYVPEPLLDGITTFEIESASIYALLDRVGYPASHAKQVVSADVWSEQEAADMEVRPGQAALILKRKTYSRGGTPIEFAVMRFRQRAFHVDIQLSRVPGSTSVNLTTEVSMAPESLIAVELPL
jgi:GntR family transcriptional regulator